MRDQFQPEIDLGPDLTEVEASLLDLVDEGLLEMGVDDNGDLVFWATARGVIELEMEPLRATG